MSIAATKATRIVHRNEDYINNGKLLERLGGIPAERVRLWPPPGTATFADLIANNDGDPFAQICELIDGTLVEKPMGFAESEAAQKLGFHLELWNQEAKLGLFAGEGGVVKLAPKTGQAPDIAFYRFDQFPSGKPPKESVPAMYPDLAVEVLSKSNTRKEMHGKRITYFAAGTRLVWEVDLKKQIVVVYREPATGETLTITDILDGEDVLPGFKLPIRKWMDSLTLS